MSEKKFENKDIERIKERLAETAQLLEAKTVLNTVLKTKIQQDLTQDHQQAVVREANAGEEIREKWRKLREDIEKQQQKLQQIEYLVFQKKTSKLQPRQKVLQNTVMAFLVGGMICTFGQYIFELFSKSGLLSSQAGTATSTVLVFLGALLTGLGIYDEIGRVAGAGSIVPITGFANSITSSALEFKHEGYIYGVGARLFTVAGPVIVYGVAVSMVIGLIQYFIR